LQHTVLPIKSLGSVRFWFLGGKN